MVLRVLHFSDVHVQAPLHHLPAIDWASKRAVGALNLLARRGRLFRDAPRKLAELDAFRREHAVDAVVCTGDYTALGTEEEHRMARAAIDPLTRAPRGFATVPGNHDLYLPDVIAADRFERHFGDLLASDLPERAVEGRWPTVRFVGDELAVVGVQTARPNPNPVRSSGAISASQLSALEALLGEAALAERWVFVLAHYALLRRDGAPDSAHHGLDNADELAAVCCAHPRAVWLHGHVHWRYAHASSPGRPPTFGAGSTTYRGREGAWLYEVTRQSVCALPIAYVEERGYVLAPEAPIVLQA